MTKDSAGGTGSAPVSPTLPFRRRVLPGFDAPRVASHIAPETGIRGDGEVRETVLANGLHVLTERIPGVRSVATGVWVRQGSSHEQPAERGISHLLEHMVFKGTRSRSAKEIALSLESLGGSLDAYTSREHTSFQARVLDEHLEPAVDVLADLVLEPVLREEDLALEREVVLEEIATVADTPDDLVFELHGERFWRGHGYGHSILGSPQSVRELDVAALRTLQGSRYCGRNLVVAAAGRVDHDEFVGWVEQRFGDTGDPEGLREVATPPSPERGDERVVRDTAQSHVVFGAELVPHADRRRFALILLFLALGGGMSSRLFQRVREELGLAYSVYSFQSFLRLSGWGGVYVGTRPEFEERAVDAIREELGRVAEEGLPEEELEQTKRQLSGQLMLSLEAPGARLHRLAGSALNDEPYVGLEELLELVRGVSGEEVRSVAAEFLMPERFYVLRLGPERADSTV